MHSRRPLYGVTVGLVLLLCPALRAAPQVRTQNFIVDAPDAQTAQEFGHMAEYYRKQKAIEWLGQEMPAWPRPCPLTVKPNSDSTRTRAMNRISSGSGGNAISSLLRVARYSVFGELRDSGLPPCASGNTHMARTAKMAKPTATSSVTTDTIAFTSLGIAASRIPLPLVGRG